MSKCAGKKSNRIGRGSNPVPVETGFNLPKDARNITGHKLRELRYAADLSQMELEDKLGRLGYELNQSLIARIESGKRSVWDYELVLFAKALKVPVWRFFGDRAG
ncbi:MAG: helix-turn-helix domain-containing protein [Verrucomicrobiales bacterium]|jgi:hypothetical protein|nr:helix-turn-helix domain-containing protein [Verrucomicrobiales bacterium]